MRRKLKQHQPSATTNFQDPLRLSIADLLDSMIEPFPHFLDSDWLSCIAALPSNDIESGILVNGSDRWSVGLVVKGLPLLNLFPVQRRLQRQRLIFQVQHHISHQLVP